MENKVSENTCVALASLDASTVEAMRAAFVERDDGYLTPIPDP